MDDDHLEPFFAGCDEATMAQLISLFESGDEKQLNKFLDGISDEDAKKQLRRGLEQIKNFKQMDAGDF